MIRAKDKTVLIRVEAISGEHFVVRILIAAILMCVAAYLYFVGVSIMNVIANREASLESERLQSLVGTLEEEYFALSKAISPENGAVMGLSKTADTSFVRRGGGMASNVTPSDI